MADVQLSYKGSTIGSLSASGTLTMETQGKYCEDDITLTYVAPSGGGSVKTGSFTIASDTSVPATGLTLDIGLTSHPDILYVWMDYDDYVAISSPTNGKWYKWTMAKNDPSVLSTVLPIRSSNTASAQSLFASADWVVALCSNVITCNDTYSTTGYAAAGPSYVSRNVLVNNIASDGKITIATNTAGAQTLLAAKYHFLAITIGATPVFA